MTRRELIFAGTGAAVTAFPGCRSLLGGEEYSVPLLGDVHYDSSSPDVFHAEFRRLHADDGLFAKYRSEFESFSSMWGKGGRSASIVKASGACRLGDAAFALQLGDLVEGDCESSVLHERMLSEAFGFMKGAYGDDLPFVTVCGNHDIRRGGNRQGEYDTYCRISAAWHARELGVAARGPTFAFRQGPDLWIVADFNRPDPDLIERLLETGGPSRYTFFCTHGAVLTDGDRSRRRWFFLGCPQYDATGRRTEKKLV